MQQINGMPIIRPHRAETRAWWVTPIDELNDLCPLQMILGKYKLAVIAPEVTQGQAEMLVKPWRERFDLLLKIIATPTRDEPGGGEIPAPATPVREKFEAWARDNGFGLELDSLSEYGRATTRAAWDAWQAVLAQQGTGVDDCNTPPFDPNQSHERAAPAAPVAQIASAEPVAQKPRTLPPITFVYDPEDGRPLPPATPGTIRFGYRLESNYATDEEEEAANPRWRERMLELDREFARPAEQKHAVAMTDEQILKIALYVATPMYNEADDSHIIRFARAILAANNGHPKESETSASLYRETFITWDEINEIGFDNAIRKVFEKSNLSDSVAKWVATPAARWEDSRVQQRIAPADFLAATPAAADDVQEAFMKLCEALGIPATAGAHLEVPRLLAATPAAQARPVTPLTCPKCHALWLFWPKEQTGDAHDSLNLRSAAHCSFCEHASAGQLQSLNRIQPNVQASAEVTDWILVSERLPKAGEAVLVAVEFGGPGDWRIKVGGLREDRTWTVFGASWEPSRWMPLPPPPVTLAQREDGRG